MQVGEGAFLRAFAGWMIERLNRSGEARLAITIAKPRPGGTSIGMLNAQDRLYTVLTRGVSRGEVVDEAEIVTAIDAAIDPAASWGEFMELARDPALRFVISNTTEIGLDWKEEAAPGDAAALSYPARLAALLHARWRAGLPGLVMLPTELIEGNGARLRESVARHTEAWSLEAEFRRWLERENLFLNTLVDRIVSGFPAGEEDEIFARLDYEDRLLTVAEPFHLWVIEGPAELAEELPLRRAGLNVVWTDDQRPWRERKVRILNGAHSVLAPVGLALGVETVGEAVRDARLGGWLRGLVEREIVPALDQPAAVTLAYMEEVFERFANPFLRHRLESIMLNAAGKWQARLLPTLLESHRQRGEWPARLTAALAALVWLHRPGGEQAAAKEDRPAREALATAWCDGGDRMEEIARAALETVPGWEALAGRPELAAALGRVLAAMKERGARALLEVEEAERER